MHYADSTKQKHHFQTGGLITQIYVKTDSASPVEEKKKTKKTLFYFFSSVHFTFRIPPFENQNAHTNAQVYIHMHVKKYTIDTTNFPFKMLVTSFCILLCWKRRSFCFLLFVPGFAATRNSDQQFFMMQHMEKRTCLAQKGLPCVEKAGINGLQHIC